jgi:hypothetical protein
MQEMAMAPEMEQVEMTARQGVMPGMLVHGMAVECIVFDQADRPKRRHLLPLAGLLKPLSGPRTGIVHGIIAADAS